MALSDEEQRLLEQMEAALAAEDPKLVNALRGTSVRRVHRRRAALAGVGFFAGLGLLIAMEVKGGVLRKHELLVHPPTAPEGLDLPRNIIAVITLALFALLFMPEPFTL